MSAQHTADNVLIDLDAESQRDLLRNAQTTPAGVTAVVTGILGGPYGGSLCSFLALKNRLKSLSPSVLEFTHSYRWTEHLLRRRSAVRIATAPAGTSRNAGGICSRVHCCDDSGPGFGLSTLRTVVATVDGFTALLDWLTVCSGGDG
jgi:hypothetical protein